VAYCAFHGDAASLMRQPSNHPRAFSTPKHNEDRPLGWILCRGLSACQRHARGDPATIAVSQHRPRPTVPGVLAPTHAAAPQTSEIVQPPTQGRRRPLRAQPWSQPAGHGQGIGSALHSWSRRSGDTRDTPHRGWRDRRHAPPDHGPRTPGHCCTPPADAAHSATRRKTGRRPRPGPRASPAYRR
jgi:hypothetical protein